VTFLEDSKFFFTLYHAGKVNIILHLVSFSFLFYGLTMKSVPLVLIGLLVFDETGHAYNYFFVHNRDPRYGLRMIPYQFLYGALIMLVLLKLFRWRIGHCWNSLLRRSSGDWLAHTSGSTNRSRAGQFRARLMTGRSFAPDGFDFTLLAPFFHFQDWPATFLLVL
jgi:hypothetical protein